MSLVPLHPIHELATVTPSLQGVKPRLNYKVLYELYEQVAKQCKVLWESSLLCKLSCTVNSAYVVKMILHQAQLFFCSAFLNLEKTVNVVVDKQLVKSGVQRHL